MTHIVGHLTVAELKARRRAARTATGARHTQAIWPLAQGRSVPGVAGDLALTPRWRRNWPRAATRTGPDLLGDQRRRNGRTASVLSPALRTAWRPDPIGAASSRSGPQERGHEAARIDTRTLTLSPGFNGKRHHASTILGAARPRG